MQNITVAVSPLTVPVPKGWLDVSVITVLKVPCTRCLQLIMLSWPPVLFHQVGSVVAPPNLATCSLLLVSAGLSLRSLRLQWCCITGGQDSQHLQQDGAHGYPVPARDQLHTGGEAALPCEILTRLKFTCIIRIPVN